MRRSNVIWSRPSQIASDLPAAVVAWLKPIIWTKLNESGREVEGICSAFSNAAYGIESQLNDEKWCTNLEWCGCHAQKCVWGQGLSRLWWLQVWGHSYPVERAWSSSSDTPLACCRLQERYVLSHRILWHSCLLFMISTLISTLMISTNHYWWFPLE